MYSIVIDENFTSDFKMLLKENKKFVNKLNTFIEECKEHPKTGTGHVEPLKHSGDGHYSRRITKKHRFTYFIDEIKMEVILFSCYGHYE